MVTRIILCATCDSMQCIHADDKSGLCNEDKACPVCGYALRPKTHELNRVGPNQSLHPNFDGDTKDFLH